MRNIAIIPARSGSKGLINKNIRLLNGKPMMAYSIEAAIKSGMFEEIYVSTDSKEYAEIGRKYGASVPFLRNIELSGDTSGSWEVVQEALKTYEMNYNRKFDTVTLLQPTSPLRTKEDIKMGYDLMFQKNANTIVSVEKLKYSPEECSDLPEDLLMTYFVKEEHVQIQRQQLNDYYRINGGLYITKIEQLSHIEQIYRNNCFAYIMPMERSVDIDTQLDFDFAEFLLKKYR